MMVGWFVLTRPTTTQSVASSMLSPPPAATTSPLDPCLFLAFSVCLSRVVHLKAVWVQRLGARGSEQVPGFVSPTNTCSPTHSRSQLVINIYKLQGGANVYHLIVDGCSPNTVFSAFLSITFLRYLSLKLCVASIDQQ